MQNRRLTAAAILVASALVALVLTYLLLNSTSTAIAGLAGFTGLALIFLEPAVGLVSYLLLVYVRPQDYVPALMGTPVMLILGAATCAIVLLRMAITQRRITLAHSPNNMLVLWFTGAIIVSQLATLVPAGVMNAITNFLPTVILYLLVANLATTMRRVKFTLNLLVVLTLVLAVQGIVQSFTGRGLGGQETYEGRIQAIGIFSDPNDLAMALVMVQPLVLLKLIERARPGEKLGSLIAMAVITYALFLTQSRGGLLSFGMLIMIMLQRRFGRAIGLGVGGVIMLAIVVLSPRMSTISAEEGSTYGRIEAWTTGMDLFQSRPLFGVGFDNYTEYHFRTAHNSLVLCAAELGVVGLFPWIMLLFLSIKNLNFIGKGMRAAGRHEDAVYVEAIRYSLFSYCLAAYFLSRTYNELLFIVLGLTTAITHIFVKSSEHRYVLFERRDFAQGLAVMVGALILTKFFLIGAW